MIKNTKIKTQEEISSRNKSSSEKVGVQGRSELGQRGSYIDISYIVIVVISLYLKAHVRIGPFSGSKLLTLYLNILGMSWSTL